MTGHRSLKLAAMVLGFVACSSRVAAQEATPTDDAFESANTLTEPR